MENSQTIESGSLRFSQHFKVTRDESDDWFDPLLHLDSRFYIDPFLVFGDNDPFWSETKDALPKYISLVRQTLARSNRTTDRHRRRAVDMLTFPEPNEYLLGTSISRPRGRGPGKVLANAMLREIEELPYEQVDAVNLVRGFDVFCAGFGVDMFSDMMGNIFISKFIEYTQEVCRRHSIPMRQIPIRRSKWDQENLRWLEAKHELPHNPELDIAVLLTPERFLRQTPYVTAGEYYDYIAGGTDENQELRDLMNELVEEAFIKNEGPPTSKDRAEIARILAHKDPSVANSYIDLKGEETPHPYDFSVDPNGDFQWYEDARRVIQYLPPLPVSDNITDVPVNDFANTLIDRFKNAVEERAAWRILWDEDKSTPRKEDTVQAMMHEVWLPDCRHANIDINSETNKGRGPADFKLSRGNNSVIIEVKRDTNSKLEKGLSEQLPQYMRAHGTDFGYYVVIVYTDRFFENGRDIELTSLAKAQSTHGYFITVQFVDARLSTKQSASKL